MELVSLNLKTSKLKTLSFVRRRNGGSPQTSSQWRNTCTERHQIDTRHSVHLAPRDDASCQIDQDRVQIQYLSHNKMHIEKHGKPLKNKDEVSKSDIPLIVVVSSHISYMHFPQASSMPDSKVVGPPFYRRWNLIKALILHGGRCQGLS